MTPEQQAKKEAQEAWMSGPDVPKYTEPIAWMKGYAAALVSERSKPRPTVEQATLVIGDERVFTESEVKAIIDEAELLARTMGTLVLDVDEARAMASSDIATIKVRHGVSLDPA